MLATKCPGQDMRYWTTDDVHEEKCPQCGEMIEFFKTDIRLRCPNCKCRVANPKFDMGCAQWCAHAEMCLGPSAKGLKQNSLKVVVEEEFKNMAREYPHMINTVQDAISVTEHKCREKQINMLPIIISVAIFALKKIGCISDADTFLERINQKQTFPQEALKETRILVDNLSTEKTEGTMEKVLSEILEVINNE